MPHVLPTSQSPLLESILAEWCTGHRKDPESPNTGQARWLTRDNSDSNSITIKPETVSHIAELVSSVPLPCCFLPGHPFPIVFCFVSLSVFSNNSFPSVKEPTLGPWKGVPIPATVLSVWNVLLPGFHDYTFISYNSVQTSLSQWSPPWQSCWTWWPTLPHPPPCSNFSSSYTTYHLLTHSKKT